MSETLKYKSEVKSITDYRDISLAEFIPDSFVIDDVKLQKDIERLIRRKAQSVSVEMISNGDIAEVSCRSSMKKFNKEKLQINVGRYLYDHSFEDDLIGHECGKTYQIEIDGNMVEYTIHAVTQLKIPELSEEEMKEMRSVCIDKQIQRYIEEEEEADMASAIICMRVAEQSEFVLDEEELKAIEEKTKQNDDPEIREMMKTVYLNSFKNALIGAYLMERDGMELSENEYQALKKYYTLREFMDSKYAEYYIAMVDRYVAEGFMNALNPERNDHV